MLVEGVQGKVLVSSVVNCLPKAILQGVIQSIYTPLVLSYLLVYLSNVVSRHYYNKYKDEIHIMIDKNLKCEL